VELCGAGDVPVHAGVDRPLLRSAEDATWFHGQDGLGESGVRAQARSAQRRARDRCDDRVIARYPGITLVTLGPLSNVASALLRDPSLAKRVGRCVIMGGNPCCGGNVTPGRRVQHLVRPRGAPRSSSIRHADRLWSAGS
jgi:purine nucleosidase